ncbi:hypothetical protein [uncultured Campylobacter sp.]|uniref:hypothetical protein n=1 Tax=uncultured Campylobacter sp. TaxID=218934 RepID=UPI00262BBC3B|nr:hypothetical protein [uncultured Campylobacter sp.]
MPCRLSAKPVKAARRAPLIICAARYQNTARRQINDAYVIRSLAVFVPPQSKLPNRNTRDLAAPHGEI